MLHDLLTKHLATATLRSVAADVGVCHMTVSNWAKGIRKPSTAQLARLADVMELDAAERRAVFAEAADVQPGELARMVGAQHGAEPSV